MTDTTATIRERLRIHGLVQAVGFRPFVFAQATRHGLTGWVCNGPDGVTIEIEGPAEQIAACRDALSREAPPHARIDAVDVEALPVRGGSGFEIRASEVAGHARTPVLPDLALCRDCRRELMDPTDRRFRYPFISCTQCGPRWSIVESLPFDRDNTAMRHFPLCTRCAAEYRDPGDRRFHAQISSCPDCGPRLALLDAGGGETATGAEALAAAVEHLRSGRIVALKGLGGFQLLVDARDAEAVTRLRRRKRRPDKPLAVMFADLDSLHLHCHADADEVRALTAAAAPIVLLRQRGTLPATLAPGNPYLGAMLPCTPLHLLLLLDFGAPLVATSGNRSGEPLCRETADAVEHLAGIADHFLVHDRPVVRAVDDSVVQISGGRVQYLRRARGAAPLLPADLSPPAGARVLAVGAHLKSTIAVAAHGRCALSAHIGDLDTPRAVDTFEQRVSEFQTLYGCVPDTVAHDAHPDYHSTRHAARRSVRRVAVQHHHAHVVAGMVEHGLTGEVLGVAWDGNGLGSDGGLWGGEFLRADRRSCERIARLRPFPLPGGEAAMREPRRSAAGLLHVLGEHGSQLASLRAFDAAETRILQQMLARGVNCPLTSAAGRLFDGVAALLGLHQRCSFEGQAAMALQFAAEADDSGDTGIWPLPLDSTQAPWTLDWAPLLTALLDARRRDLPIAAGAARFHRSLAAAIAATAQASGLHRVVLGGGCFQNRLLLELTIAQLRARELEVYWPQQLPANDGALAAGQLGVAIATLDP